MKYAKSKKRSYQICTEKLLFLSLKLKWGFSLEIQTIRQVFANVVKIVKIVQIYKIMTKILLIQGNSRQFKFWPKLKFYQQPIFFGGNKCKQSEIIYSFLFYKFLYRNLYGYIFRHLYETWCVLCFVFFFKINRYCLLKHIFEANFFL